MTAEREVADLSRTSEGLAAEIERMIAPTLVDMGFEIVRVSLMGGEGRSTLQIMAERPDGTMGIDECTEISRAVSALLDIEDPIQGRFDLEVSSPGIDRPLTRLKDYVRYAGLEARIELELSLAGRRRYRGRIVGVEGENVVLAEEGQDEHHRISFPNIARAKLVMTDELLELSGKSAAAANN